MGRIIVFDTNFIFSNKSKITEIVKKLAANNFDCYTLEICIEELKAQRRREIIDKHMLLKEFLREEVIVTYFKVNDITDINESILRSESRLDQFAKNVFNENIIKVSDREGYFTKLIDRCGYRKPPFEKNEKSSDKGFKDTIIWLSILDYAKDHSSDDFILVTKDGAFQKNKEELIEEFCTFTKTTIEILCMSDTDLLFTSLGIGEQKKESDVKQFINDNEKKVGNDFIIDINSHIIELTHYVDSDPFSNSTGELCRRFIIFDKLDNEKAEKIINQITIDVYGKYSLFMELDFTSVLKEFGIASENRVMVNRETLINVVKDFESFLKNFPEQKESFVELFKSMINDLYVYEPFIDPDNLPF